MKWFWIDKKFAANKKHYLLQPVVAIVFLFFVLMALDSLGVSPILGVIGSTSLGSSAFLVLSAPDTPMAQPRRMLGSYLICIFTGVFCWWVSHVICAHHASGFFSSRCNEFFAAIATAVSMLLMTALDFEHPPAAGLALGLVVEPWDMTTLAVIFAAVVVLSIVKRIIRRWLINLV